MTRARTAFRQADITRAGRGALKAGLPVRRGDPERLPGDRDNRAAANRRRAVVRRIDPVLGAAILAQVPAELVEKEKGCGSCVYFMRVGDRMKIGMSKNVRGRAKEIQTGQSEPVEVVYSVKGGRELEKYFHVRFVTEKLHGEWFKYRGPLKAFLDGLPFNESEHSLHEWRL